MQIRPALCALLLMLPMSCGDAGTHSTDDSPAMRWDHRPEAEIWTARTLTALQNQGAGLTDIVPADIYNWCPGYVKANDEERRAFWAGILSALAKHESTWNPQASGGGGKWIGLVQIAPGTARAFGCDATTASALKNGGANLACGVQIAAVQVARDGLVAGNGTKGLGRDWAPFRSAAKRADMAAWTRAQTYCN